MAVVRRVVRAPRPRVWDVLADPFSYSRWVPGTKEIRDADENWPKPGSRLHFTAGVGPLNHKDHTSVLECEPGHRLVLEAKAWPLGTARVELVLTDTADTAGTDGTVGTDGACVLCIDEHPLRGVAGKAHNPVFDAGFWLRGRLMARRLARQVER